MSAHADRVRELLREAHRRMVRLEYEQAHQAVADALRLAEADPESRYYARLHEAADRIRPDTVQWCERCGVWQRPDEHIHSIRTADRIRPER